MAEVIILGITIGEEKVVENNSNKKSNERNHYNE